MSEPGVVIAGAGPCGLGAAWTLHHEFPSHPFLLIDENRVGGGCARSETTPEGFTFDLGGHVLFPHQEFSAFRKLLQLVNEWRLSCPARYVYMQQRLIPTPVQRNLHRLPLVELVPILVDLLWQGVKSKFSQPRRLDPDGVEESLGEFLHASFGTELSKRVMQPLNQKMWTLDPFAMSSAWTRHRSGSQLTNVPRIKLGRVIKNLLLSKDDPASSATSTVSYPAVGGTGVIWQKVLDCIDERKVRLTRRVMEIRTSQKCVVLSDNTSEPYTHLISTMPLDVLLKMCVDRPGLGSLASGLLRSSVSLFGFGIKGVLPGRYKSVHSFQCPQPDLPFWRVTIPSNLSAGNVPDANLHYSVLCEVSYRPADEIHSCTNLRQGVLNGLLKIGLLQDTGQIVSQFEEVLSHGYPVPFLGRDRLLRSIQKELEALSIFSRGRFGAWRYEVSNQDYAFMQGSEAARHVVRGDREVIYNQRFQEQ